MKKIFCVLLSAVMIFALTACAAENKDAQHETVIRCCEQYLNGCPKSSAMLIEYAPFTASSLTYGEKLHYACVRTAEEYAVSGNTKQKSLAEKSKVSVSDAADKLSNAFGTELSSLSTKYTNGGANDTVTFAAVQAGYTPAFALNDISFSGDECTAVFKVTKVNTAGKSEKITFILTFTCEASQNKIENIRFLKAEVAQ